MNFSHKQTPSEEAPVLPAPDPDKTAKLKESLKESQAARKAAEQRAEALAEQITTAKLEIMRLKSEIYDLTHGLT